MKIKDLKKMSKDNLPLLDALKHFSDSDIILHEGKWDFELNYGEEYCIHCYGDTSECDCDEPEDEDESNFFSACAIQYIDEDGEYRYDSFDEEFDELQGSNIGGDYNIFFDGMARTIYLFKNDMMCDGVVEGFFDFDNYIMIDGELQRQPGWGKEFTQHLESLNK